MAEAVSPHTPTGSLLQLSGRVRLDGLWLGPAAAALAGALAGDWIAGTGKILLLALLADLGWGNLWWAVAGTDWRTMRDRWNTWVSEKAGPAGQPLPYLQLASPAGRLLCWWADLRAWNRVALWPARGAQLGAILIGLPIALALSAVLGTEMVLMTLAVLAMSQLALFMGPADGFASPLAHALVEIGIPWLSGGLLSGRLDGALLVVAAGLVIAYLGLILVGRGRRGGIWLVFGHLVILIVLLTVHRPLGAAAVGTLLLPTLALLPWHAAGLEGRATLRLAQWPFLLVILTVALAL